MSRTANWSYVAYATAWKKTVIDEWDQSEQWSEPIIIKCSYSGKSQIVRNSTGDEITSTLEFLTEYPDLKEGDRIAIGENAPFENSQEIMAISRDMDLFYMEADDFSYYT